MSKFQLESVSEQRRRVGIYVLQAAIVLLLLGLTLVPFGHFRSRRHALHTCSQRDEWGLLPLPQQLAEDFAVATWTSAPRHSIVKAMRPFRRGIRTVIFTNATAEQIAAEQKEGERYEEQWVQLLSESNTTHNASTHPPLFYSRGAQAAVRPIEVFGTSFKWLVFGDDDVLMFWPGILRAIKGLRHTDPYYLTDSYYGQRDPNHLRAEAAKRLGKRRRLSHAIQQPRCVPCTVNMTAMELAARIAFKTCNCTGAAMRDAFAGWLPEGMDWSIEAPIWSFDGAGGAIISLNYLQMVNTTRYYECTRAGYKDRVVGPFHQSGSDSLTTGCFWREGLGYTDSGWSLDHKEWQTHDMLRGGWFQMRNLLSSAIQGDCTPDKFNCSTIVQNAVSLHGGGQTWQKLGRLDDAVGNITSINRLAALYAEMHDPLEALLPAAG